MRAVAGVAGLAAAAQLPVGRAEAAPRPDGGDQPFTLGVASGDPSSTGVVLWTRLAPRPFEPGGGMPARRVPVRWQISADERFRRVAAAGTAWALPDLAHSVHVEVDGLAPGREWFYRFSYRGDLSPVGRTRTSPRRGARLDRFTVASVSCQAWTDGFYPSLGHIAADDGVDLVLHLGDYVYEGGIPADGGYRGVTTPEVLRQAPRDLERWRMQYALYKSDAQLQAAHARHPFLVTWDDHEVQNDYAGTLSQYEGDITALRAAAYQAWYEHQPVRAAAIPGADGPRIYRRSAWGDLAHVQVVDGRQYRDVPPCGWGEADACDAAYDPSVTMLGRQQERWLAEGWKRSDAIWDVLGSNVMLARLDHDGPAGTRLWHDAWDGFPAARVRLVQEWTANARNAVALTGDWHSTFVNDIRADFDAPGSPVVATELVGTSISSNGDGEVYGPYYGPMIPFNPHIRYFDGDRRGYLRSELTRTQMRTELRVVDTVSRPDAPESTLAAFVTEDGRPGAVRV